MRLLALGLLFALTSLAARAAHGQSAALHWDPATGACNDAVLVSAVGDCEDECIGLSAPRELSQPTLTGESVEVGLWDPSLGFHQGQAVATITAPDGTTAAAIRERYGPTWLSLHYPADFAGARSTGPGTYTIVWETRGLTICDGFEVSSLPARLGAPSGHADDSPKVPGRAK